MSKRYTTETFVEMMNEIYKGKNYDFSEAEYVSSATKVKVICSEHGVFYKRANKLQQGTGNCTVCMESWYRPLRRKSHEDFVAQLLQVSPWISVGSSIYETSRKKIEVLCNKHNCKFTSMPNDLLSGTSCKLCFAERIRESHVKPQEVFVEEATAISSGKYGYEKVNYVNCKVNVCIVCRGCGNDFWQLPSNHLKGYGCPTCAVSGYKPDAPGILYVLSGPTLTKIGITNKSLNERLSSMRKGSGEQVVVVKTYNFENGSVPQKIEKKKLFCPN